MKYTINQGIGIFENAISDEWCDYLIKLYEDNKVHHRKRKDTEKTPTYLKDDTCLSVTLLDKEFYNTFVKYFYKTIYPLYSEVFFGLDQGGFHTIMDVKLQKTLPSQGYHLWHCENGDKSCSNRVAVYTIYLNNVKEGGETEFLYQSLRVSPKKGTATIFPSGYYHTHRGNPPLSGEKYILTGWLELIDKPKNE
jgi:hypothetical protein